MNVLYLAESVLPVINGIQSAFYSVYHFLLSLGYIIISFIIGIFGLFNKIIGASAYIIIILQEDFEIFKHDLQASLSPLLNSAIEIIKSSFATLYQAYVFIESLFFGALRGMNSLSEHFQWLKAYVENICSLIFDSLSLIGYVFIYCVDSLRYFFSIETCAEFARVVTSNTMKNIHFILRQDVLFGLLIVIFLTAISLKSKVHMKIFNVIKLFIFNLSISSLFKLKSMLMFIRAFLAVMRRKLRSARDYLHPRAWKKIRCKRGHYDLQRLLEQEKAEKLCIICMDRKRNVMLLNCQHLILCNVCVATIVEDSGVCPVCRRNIINVMMVYT